MTDAMFGEAGHRDHIRVSVAMGTFNGAKHLPAQLDSMLRQKRVPDELVVSDDGSTDATLAILEAFRSTAPFDVHILRSEGRLGENRNIEPAISACRGDFVTLSDQDDIWMADRVERSVAALRERPGAGYAFSDAQIIDEGGSVQSDTLWSRVGLSEARRIRYQSGDQLPALLNGPNFIYGMAMTIRRAFVADVLPILARSPSCTHDTWTALTMSGSGHDGVMIDACLVQYRQHAAQVVGAGSTRATASMVVRRSLRSKRYFDPLFPADLDAAADRIAVATDPARLQAADRMRAKATHLRIREQATTLSAAQRMLAIGREFLSGRYSDYSDSWKTAARDLIS